MGLAIVISSRAPKRAPNFSWILMEHAGRARKFSHTTAHLRKAGKPRKHWARTRRQRKIPQMDVLRDLVSWRKGRDSNSRYPIGYAAFPGRYIKPLCHPSSGSSFIRSGVGLSRQPERRLCQRRDCVFYRSCFFFARAFATQKLPDSPFDRSWQTTFLITGRAK